MEDRSKNKTTFTGKVTGPNTIRVDGENISCWTNGVEEPWSQEIQDEVEHNVIRDIAEELEVCRKTRDDWLKEKKRLMIKAGGIAMGAASSTLAILAAPLTPIALTTGALTLATGTAIPGLEWLLDGKDGKKAV